MPEWDSEIEISAGRASALIAEQFPSLDATPLRQIGEGWDNTVWANGQDIAFRFPRREIAIPGIEREIAILPDLAALLPAPIPDAQYVGVASPAFEWPWLGSQLVDGVEIAEAHLGVDRRGRLAADLGGFLAALHDLRLSASAALPVDPMGRADMARRIPQAQAALDRVAHLWEGEDRVERILETAGTLLLPDTDLVLVHGDLNLRHALVSRSGGLAGVIDWGDMCRAPRAVDLALYWSLFDRHARADFRAAYGSLSEATLTRARVLALFMDATLAAYAENKGMADLEREALAGLSRTITD